MMMCRLFDICTIEREWTLSVESKASMQRWLQIVTRAIDEDTAIVPTMSWSSR